MKFTTVLLASCAHSIALSVWITVWKDLISILLLSLPMSLLFGVHGLWAGILLAPFLNSLDCYNC